MDRSKIKTRAVQEDIPAELTFEEHTARAMLIRARYNMWAHVYVGSPNPAKFAVYDADTMRPLEVLEYVDRLAGSRPLGVYRAEI